MLAGKNETFPPLTSASPRLLFDFLLALISPKYSGKTTRNTACRLASSCEDVEVPDPSIKHLKTADLMQKAASQISWEPKSGYTTTLPDGVGERTGGFRRLMQPRLTFGHDTDELDFHRGLGFVWIVILLPLGAVLFLIWRWVTKTMQPPVRTSAATNNAVTSAMPVVAPPAAAP